jgi:diguanylate cyclase (GGDEF)-like protein/PAS domain S-box-containing protein
MRTGSDRAILHPGFPLILHCYRFWVSGLLMAKTWITAVEAARRLDLSMSALGELADRGVLRPKREGVRAADDPGSAEGTLYRNEDIEAFARVFVRRRADETMQDLMSQLSRATDELEQKRTFLTLLTDQKRRTDNILDMSHDVIWETDAAGRFTFLNQSATELFGEPMKRLIGRCFFSFEAREKHIANRRFLSQLRTHGEVRNFITSIASSKRTKWLGINAKAIFNADGLIEKMCGTIRDITEQQEAEQRLREQAKHDPLTGLYNRSALIERLEAELRSGHRGAMLTIDIDYFEVVNEALGPREGDAVIRALGGVLNAELRESDNATLYHLGGDEFAVICRETSRKAVTALGERLRLAIGHYVYRSDEPAGSRGETAASGWNAADGQQPPPDGSASRSVNYTASAGVVLFPFDGDTPLELMKNTRVAMYMAKEAGRNRLMFFDQPNSNPLRSATSRQSWYQRIQAALAEDRFELYAQPVCRLDDGTGVHQEVLVRMREGERLLQPAEFIHHAEENGLIKLIDERVVQKTLSVIHSRTGSAPKFFVNLSRVSISDQAWVRLLLDTLRRARLGRTALVFEITETAAMRDIDTAVQFIREVKALGHAFALDDFGARFSTFDYLEKFDVDYIKIDGAFAQDLPRLAHRRVLVRSICEIARELGKQVVAESIEDQATSRIFTESGAHYGQGFYFGHPSPIAGCVLPAALPIVASRGMH